MLNENPEELKKDIGFAVSGTISRVMTEIVEKIFPLVPLDEIFLPA